MKSFLLISLAATSLLSAQTGDPRIRDSNVQQKLEKARMQVLQSRPQSKPEPAKGSDAPPVQPQAVPDLVANSDILCYNGTATLVPKRAILHQPPGVTSRVNQYQPGSKLLSWLDFYSQNRGWITTVEVNRGQAQGKEALDEKTVERFRKGTSLVVATYQGGPVSVHPPPEPAAGTAGQTATKPNP